ncbi:hypothetical protein CVT25_014050 [Psilocybe cyanescens]|uniref:Uncharacterized protein n=1 Tax=Psilocybe cyanescens TaxID=93625 RepID=A0A409X503_PSICY|nr:hypothetical protein CVT25_014050 [Psilocybe cyanescens]
MISSMINNVTSVLQSSSQEPSDVQPTRQPGQDVWVQYDKSSDPEPNANIAYTPVKETLEDGQVNDRSKQDSSDFRQEDEVEKSCKLAREVEQLKRSLHSTKDELDATKGKLKPTNEVLENNNNYLHRNIQEARRQIEAAQQ